MGGHWEVVVAQLANAKKMNEGVELFSKYS
jgi:hypothetical protein